MYAVEQYYEGEDRNGVSLGVLDWYVISRHSKESDAEAQLQRFIANGIPANKLRIIQSEG